MKSESIVKHFAWETPLLPEAAEWLIHHALTNDSRIDLSAWDVVLPSGRATARLAELIAAIAKARGCELKSPNLLTVGELASRLVTPTKMPAMEFEQTLAWAAVLADLEAETLSILLPKPPEVDAMDAWLELGGTLRRLASSLAAENLTFDQVLSHATTTAERQRWSLLCQIGTRYLSHLNDADRSDPSAAALDAIATQTCATTRSIVLVGTTDLSPMLQAMLAQIKTPIHVLIAAPENLADRFGRFGNLVESKWQDHHLPLRDEHLIAADSMTDQAQAVFEIIENARSDRRSDEITLGVTDESQVDAIAAQCEWHDIATHRNLGHTVGQTAIGRIIDLMVGYLQHSTWRALSALIRHADVYRLIDRSLDDQDDWLAQIDQLISETYPIHVDQPTSPAATQSVVAKRVVQRIETWLEPLTGHRRPIGFWCETLAAVLSELDPDTTKDADAAPESTDRTARALHVVLKLLERFASLSETLDAPVEGSVALSILAARITELRIADVREPGQIEILGWLDLALDDAKSMVVCGLNHPFVPESISGDPFLPPTLRRRLHQSANERRYARDVVAMHQMIASRENIRFIVGKNSADGSPTPPSRLLAAATAEHSAALVCRLLTTPRTQSAQTKIVVAQTKIVVAQTKVVVARANDSKYFAPVAVTPGKTIQTISVSGFSDYLTCPYRFYLRHVEKLRPVDDSGLELAANQFGDLVHGALEWWGDSDAKHETDPDKIANDLIEQLHAYARHKLGGNVATTVKLQIRQAERRLRAVAVQQAIRIAQGWRIHAVEASVDERDVDRITKKPKRPTGVTLDGKFTGITGRFDRIDHHPETDRWAILDYKTHGHKPEKKHLKRNPDGSMRWINLQLPLYRRVIPDLGIQADPDDVQLGYFNVAEKESETKINLAQFTSRQFAEADELILGCVRQIRDGRFKPTTETVEFDDYTMMFNEPGSFGLIDPDDEDDEFAEHPS